MEKREKIERAKISVLKNSVLLFDFVVTNSREVHIREHGTGDWILKVKT